MRSFVGAFLALGVSLLGVRVEASASMPITGELKAVRAPHALALDASLSDPAWNLGAIQPNQFWNITKRSGATLRTRMYLLYDDQNLYVAFQADQAGIPIVAGQTTNNVGFGLDDFVGVAVDCSGAGNEVYFFEMTPRATRYQQSSENVRYSARWHGAAQIDGQGWNAVLVIPLNAMRLPPTKHATWRINFIRSVASQGEHYTWAYDALMNDGPVGQVWPSFSDARYWPSMTLDGLATSGRLVRAKPHSEIYALESVGADRNLFQQANGTFAPEAVRPLGIDLTIPITNTINAVGTFNPDFSNIEVDQQVIAPQEFQRQLTEYRPFFAQGARFLTPNGVGFSSPTSPNNAIWYSPSIGPFDHGVKVEGSSGLQSFGVLGVRGFDVPSGNTFDDIAYGYRHSLADKTFYYWTDGVLAHHSVAGDDATIDVGLSGNAKNGFTWGDAQALEHGSWVPYTGEAHSSTTYIAMNKPNWFAAIAYNDLSPNYNPIDGLTFNSDIRGFQGFLQTLGSTRWAKNYSLSVNMDRWFDRSGVVHEADTLPSLAVTFNNGLSINNLGPSVSILRHYDVPANADCTGPSVGTSSFTGFPCYRNGQDERFNLFTAALGYKDGTPRPFDASFAFGPFGGNYTQTFSTTTSRPFGRYSLGLEYDGTYERALSTGVLDSQWLRRISIGASLSAESNFSISLRSINGLGGFATSTGTNIAFGYHRRFASGNELYADFGSASANSTLHRFIVKYVVHLGGDAGT